MRDSAETGDPDTTKGQFPSEEPGSGGGGGNGASLPEQINVVREPMVPLTEGGQYLFYRKLSPLVTGYTGLYRDSNSKTGAFTVQSQSGGTGSGTASSFNFTFNLSFNDVVAGLVFTGFISGLDAAPSSIVFNRTAINLPTGGGFFDNYSPKTSPITIVNDQSYQSTSGLTWNIGDFGSPKFQARGAAAGPVKAVGIGFGIGTGVGHLLGANQKAPLWSMHVPGTLTGTFSGTVGVSVNGANFTGFRSYYMNQFNLQNTLDTEISTNL